MPSEEAIQNAKSHLEQALRANELAKQEIANLRRVGMNEAADTHERRRREVEAAILRLRAIIGA